MVKQLPYTYINRKFDDFIIIEPFCCVILQLSKLASNICFNYLIDVTLTLYFYTR